MKYLLLIYLDAAWDKRPVAERQQAYGGQMKLAEELTARGQYLGGNPLHPTSSATTVRVRDGQRLLTDGPFAETREHLGGYMLSTSRSHEGSPSRRAAAAGSGHDRVRRAGGPRRSPAWRVGHREVTRAGRRRS